jgi:murein DD-endopeptidase MepM/ murein hydrolase activator NlpD
MRPFALVAAVVLAALVLAHPAAAAAGGAPAPSRAGGVAFGAPLPKPAARPIARRLAPTPKEITAGDAAPAIRLRVRQRGIERVRARLVVLRLPSRRRVAKRQLGWLRTDRSVTVRLPQALKLRTGRYLVRLHAIDPRGRTLRRSGAFPGRTRIVVRRPNRAPSPPAPALPTPALPEPAVPVPALPAPAPSPAGRGVFPVFGTFDFGGAGARFGAGRTGHIHQGQDIGAAAGTPVVAPYAGTISQTDFQASGAGEYVVLDGADGRDYFFTHCLRRSTLVAEGTAVTAGQPLCRVGATGTTSGAAHLHFEIWQVGWRVAGGVPIDPLPELRAWAGR